MLALSGLIHLPEYKQPGGFDHPAASFAVAGCMLPTRPKTLLLPPDAFCAAGHLGIIQAGLDKKMPEVKFDG